jgi:hypothetical protein
MRNTALLLLTPCLVLFALAPATADIIYDNGSPLFEATPASIPTHQLAGGFALEPRCQHSNGYTLVGTLWGHKAGGICPQDFRR